MSALVFWKDEHELDNGLKGVMEVHPFDLPGRQFRGAQVSDLIRVLNTKIQARSHEEGIYREVASFLLYGRRVNVHRFLESIIADLPGNSPRLVATMKAHAPSAAEAMICVETLTGKATRIPCTLRESVFCFKLRVQTIVGIRPVDQILIFNDVRLDSRRSLSSYGIQDESIVNLLLGLSGGFSFSRKFADVSNDSLLVTTEFDPDAPNWRTAFKGLNIEGTCTTPSCVAFGKEVIHPKHFKLFNMCLDDTPKCPMCRAQVTPLTCGFYDCVWKFEGMKASDNLTIISSWRDAVGEKYHRFNSDEKNGCSEWGSLLIVAKPRNESNEAKLTVSSDSTCAGRNDVCTICWSKLGSAVRFTVACGHDFHRCCFKKWTTWSSCRSSLSSCPACHRPVQAPPSTIK